MPAQSGTSIPDMALATNPDPRQALAILSTLTDEEEGGAESAGLFLQQSRRCPVASARRT